MLKVTGCIDAKALGHHDFEFYVQDDATDEEIKQKVQDACDYNIDYKVEAGYEEYTKVCYHKKDLWY